MSINIDQVVVPTDVQERLLLSVISYATMLEGQFEEWLVPAAPGVYMPGAFHPVLTPNKQYYTHDQGQWLPITNLDEVKTAVYDSNHRLVINPFVMQSKERFLTPYPTIPARGIKLIQKIIDLEITSVLRWCRHAQGCENRILAEFRQEYRNNVDISMIRQACRYVTVQVHEFIGNDDWNYYHTAILGPDIVVEKGPDYRICEWYQMINKEPDHGNYSY